MNSLNELYRLHRGKVSDKWALYLIEYDRLFSSYRKQQINFLEIGIQNGGSLEIWGEYFPAAQHFIGCDINQDCSNLSYNDPRISLIVANANTDATEQQIAAITPQFDIIIDDGSHTSADIVRSFARYFKHLSFGGLFVVEDLHCSYWQEFEGGLYYPYSSQAFFKKLADIVNHEFWGVQKSRVSLLDGFAHEFECIFEESVLAQIHSVEFINSMCIIRKFSPENNVLGGRFVAGTEELVVQGHLELTGEPLIGPDQSANPWSKMDRAPEELWGTVQAELSEITSRYKAAEQHIQELQEHLNRLNSDANRQMAQIVGLESHVSALLGSRSWKVTAPLRKLAGLLRGKP